LGSDGSLTGYAGGLDRKVSLLKLEGVAHKPQFATLAATPAMTLF
jgi:hypothetical protein